eukprot:7441279-Karenia_brevis.AAC.1
MMMLVATEIMIMSMNMMICLGQRIQLLPNLLLPVALLLNASLVELLVIRVVMIHHNEHH